METYTILVEGQAVVCPIQELQEFSIFAQFLEEAATDDSASGHFIIPLGAITYKAFSAIRQILTHFNGNPPFPGIHPYLEEQGWTPDSLVEAADYLGHPKLATVLAAAILSGLQHLTESDLINLATGVRSVSEVLESARLQNLSLSSQPLTPATTTEQTSTARESDPGSVEGNPGDTTAVDPVEGNTAAAIPYAHWPEFVAAVEDSNLVPKTVALPALALLGILAVESARTEGSRQISDASVVYHALHLPSATLEKMRVDRLEFVVHSHDQGWSSYPHRHGTYMGSCTWGSCRAVAANTERVLSPEAEVYRNLHAVIDWQTHRRGFDSSSPLIQGINGHSTADVDVELLAHARYPGWCNYVGEATLTCYLAPRV